MTEVGYKVTTMASKYTVTILGPEQIHHRFRLSTPNPIEFVPNIFYTI